MYPGLRRCAVRFKRLFADERLFAAMVSGAVFAWAVQVNTESVPVHRWTSKL